MASVSAGYADLDDLELEAVGYKQEMPWQFSKFSLGALSFTLIYIWLGTGSAMGISLTEALSTGTIWLLLICRNYDYYTLSRHG